MSASGPSGSLVFKVAMRVDIGKECPWIADG